MNDPEAIRGLWCATLTPLGRDGGIDHARFANHVRSLIARGVDGITPFGTTGEGQSFAVGERQAGLDGLLASGVAASRLCVATGCAAFTDTVALTRHALQSGVPRCLVLPPFFWKNLSDDAVYAYYATLIDTVADPRLRVYLYHIPQVSAVAIKPAVVERLARDYPRNIAGVKDSGGDYANTAELLERTPQLSILVGHEPHLPRLMKAGGAGTICGAANLYPELVSALLAPAVTPEAEARIQAFLEIVFKYPFLPAFKAVRALQTGDEGWRAVRTPLVPLPDADRDALAKAFSKAGFIVTAQDQQ